MWESTLDLGLRQSSGSTASSNKEWARSCRNSPSIAPVRRTHGFPWLGTTGRGSWAPPPGSRTSPDRSTRGPPFRTERWTTCASARPVSSLGPGFPSERPFTAAALGGRATTARSSGAALGVLDPWLEVQRRLGVARRVVLAVLPDLDIERTRLPRTRRSREAKGAAGAASPLNSSWQGGDMSGDQRDRLTQAVRGALADESAWRSVADALADRSVRAWIRARRSSDGAVDQALLERKIRKMIARVFDPEGYNSPQEIAHIARTITRAVMDSNCASDSQG